MTLDCTSSALGRGKIVLAEDDLATRLLLTHILRKHGFDVMACANGLAACEAIDSEKPNLILLDLHMPILDGNETIRRMRSDAANLGIPIILLTSEADTTAKIDALKSGAQDFITKPFDAAELVARIEGQLGWRNTLARESNIAVREMTTHVRDLRHDQAVLMKRYRKQRRTANALRQAFSPTLDFQIRGIAIASKYEPISRDARVGGDWYDVFPLPDGRVFFSIGDVAGHGTEAALIMVRARQSILAFALHADDPAAVLEQANTMLALQGPMLVTAICGYIDAARDGMTIAAAGHPHPIIASPEVGAAFVECRGVALGMWPMLGVQSREIRGLHGKTFVLYTDGLIEFSHDIVAGEKLLLTAVAAAVCKDANNVADDVFSAVFGRDEARDDATLVGMTFSAL